MEKPLIPGWDPCAGNLNLLDSARQHVAPADLRELMDAEGQPIIARLPEGWVLSDSAEGQHRMARMRIEPRDLMVARAVREDCAAKCTRGDAQRLLATDLTALIESLPEPAEQPRCRCGWVSVEGGEIIDPFCPVHDVPVEHEQAAQDAPSNLVGHRRGHLGIAATPLAFDPGPREATTAEIDRLEAGSMTTRVRRSSRVVLS